MSSEEASGCSSPARQAPLDGRCPTAPSPNLVAGTAFTSSSTTSTPKSPSSATTEPNSVTTSSKDQAASRFSCRTLQGTSSSSSSRPPVDSRRRLDVVVHVELPRVRAETKLVDLVLPLVGDPRVDHVLREHTSGEQEIVVGFE